jgi:putative ABC transport system ATP-binding protein
LLKPRILLCDEPTGNLDQRTGGELIETLAGLATDDGVTVVIVTHEEHVAERCDRIIRLRNGQVVDETQEGLS